MASIRPRYGKNNQIVSYEIRVSRGRDKNGKQLSPYTTSWVPPENLSQKRLEARLQKAAALFEEDCRQGKVLTKEEILAQEEAARAEALLRMTLRQYTEDIFMPRKSAVFSDNAIGSYNNCFARIFKYLGALPMAEIRPGDISSCISALQIKERKTRVYRDGTTVITNQLLSHSTVLKHYTVLHSLFGEAYKVDEIIPRNPIDKVKRPAPRKDEEQREIQALSVEAAQYLLECLKNEPLQWQVIIRLMLDTGARRGEILGLRWSDIDLENGVITIANNLQYSPRRGVYDTTTKGKRKRAIDIDPELIPLLRQLKAAQRILSLKGYVFVQEDGSPVFPQTPTKYLKALGDKYGIPNLHPHALRHTAATIAITHGADIASVSAKLGHADKSTTLDMYTHADEAAIKRGNNIYRQVLYKNAK